MTREQAAEVVLRCLSTVLQQDEQPVDVAPDESTYLMGSTAVLDSIGLVELIADIEQTVLQEQGVAIQLADERALARDPVPFRSVGSLAAYVGLLMAEQAALSQSGP
jgi:acyl carrier protein